MRSPNRDEPTGYSDAGKVEAVLRILGGEDRIGVAGDLGVGLERLEEWDLGSRLLDRSLGSRIITCTSGVPFHMTQGPPLFGSVGKPSRMLESGTTPA